ncbi:hypothetical protein ACN38_g8047 [Penicillium nordicum]|uniref:Uncharacterized protein n=1 Tax=Penicillium nordicum TaxID=229535 RepID=A0A0M8NX09_9EURO|nr:hypothetical protein ACN38_g8047 [Penicillium nordicum]
MAVWPSGLRRLTRNQFRSRAHVRIMQPSLHSFFASIKDPWTLPRSSIFTSQPIISVSIYIHLWLLTTHLFYHLFVNEFLGLI